MKFRSGARTNFTGICLCIIIAAAFGATTSCKKKAADEAITTFVVGEVKLLRQGEQERPVSHKEKLMKGDVIKTGDGSLLVFQIGTRVLIKIEANTRVAISSIMEQSSTSLELSQGKVFSNVRNLVKQESFQVRMKTSVAAVRGTEFSAEQTNKESIVAVSRGTISVQKMDEKNEVKEEQSIETGNTAVVKEKISVRPMTENEEKELARFDKITPIEDIESKSESDLKNLENEVLEKESAESPVEEKKTDKSIETKKADKPAEAKKADKPADTKKEGTDVKVAEKIKEEKNIQPPHKETSGTEAAGTVWTGKRVYEQAETVVVFYKNLPEYRNCWISVSKAGSADRSYESYNWTHSAKDGQMEFANLKLAPGNYEARVHFSRGNEVNLRYVFQVK